MTKRLSSLQLRAALVILAIFLAGGVAGAGVSRALPAAEPDALPPFPAREIGLDPQQAGRVKAILEKHKPRMDALMDEFVPRVRAIAEDVEREIDGVLTPEQRARLEEYRRGQPLPLPPWARPPGAPPPGQEERR
jgi:hypothetical protein